MTCLLCLRYLTVTTVLGIIVLVVYMSGNKYVNKVIFSLNLKFVMLLNLTILHEDH